MSEENKESPPIKPIYCMEEGQKLNLEKYVNISLGNLQTLFQKEEILKFLYKYIIEGKINFEEEIKSEGKEVTEEEIQSRQDQFCRDLKILFDQIKPNIYTKYNNRIGRAAIKILESIYKRKEKICNKIRDVKVKPIEENCEENKKKYEKLNALGPLIEEIIHISEAYISEFNNANTFLFQNLDEFYEGKLNIKFSNIINGEEKLANDDDLIDKVVTQKEKAGSDFILKNKKFIEEELEKQRQLDKEIDEMIDEFEDLNKQKAEFEEYCNRNSIFKEINELDFYD